MTIPASGTQVTALPFGANEILTAEELLDHDPYTGSREPVEGSLETIKVPADYDFNSPAYILYIVNGISVDPATITESLTASILEFANPYHDELGRFTTGDTAGSPAGAVRKTENPADIRKWARDNGHEISDRGRIPDPIQRAYRKAQKSALVTKVATKTTTTEPKPTEKEDLKSRFDKIDPTLSDDLKALAPVNRPDPNGPYYRAVVVGDPSERAAIEQRVNAAGRVLHDEITSRLREQGIRTEQGAADLRKALWTVRTQQAEEFDKFRDQKNPDETSALAHFKKMFPGQRYADATPEQVNQIVSTIDKTHPGYKEAWQKLIDTDQKIEKTQGDDNNYALAYRTTALSVLSEVRGGNYGNLSFDKVLGSVEGRNPSKEVIESIKRAGHVYPDDWVAESNAAGFVFSNVKQRGLHKFRSNSVHYDNLNRTPDGKPTKRYDLNSEVTTSRDPSLNPAVDKSTYFPTSVHEMGHRFEELRPHIKVMEEAFLHRRAKGEQPQPLRKLRPDERYEADEKAISDKFLHPYMGKVYEGGPTSNYELFTMGVQNMLGGSSYRMFNDPDYSAFILGLLAKG